MAEKKTNHVQIVWQNLFPKVALENGRKDFENGKIDIDSIDESETEISGSTENGFYVEIKGFPNSFSTAVEAFYSGINYRYTAIENFKKMCQCSCSAGNNTLCRHKASLMFAWENEHGPFEFDETEEEMAARIEHEKQVQKELALQKLKEKDVAVNKVIHVPSSSMNLIFDPTRIFSDAKTNLYEQSKYNDIKEKPDVSIKVRNDLNGDQVLDTTATIDGNKVHLILNKGSIQHLECTCDRCHSPSMGYYRFYYMPKYFCCHALAVGEELCKKIVEENPGDATDRNANSLLSLLSGSLDNQVEEVRESETKNSQNDVVLKPIITKDKNSDMMTLSFDISANNGRLYSVRSLEKLYDAVEDGEVFSVTSKLDIDFSLKSFSPESERWYNLISSYIHSIQAINKKIERRTRYYYESFTIKFGSSIPLEGNDLDMLYDMVEGEQISYQKGDKNSRVMIDVKSGRLKLEMSLQPVKDKDKNLIAVDFSGVIPKTLKGNQYQYILDDNSFTRITEEEMKALLPYERIASGDSFTCRIGKLKLPEFYYRILPGIKNSKFIHLIDKVPDNALTVLPPEPEFVFYLDKEKRVITCKAFVSYGDDKYCITGGNISRSGSFDFDQEERVTSAIARFFPKQYTDTVVSSPADDNSIMTILTSGVSTLSKYGEVKVSDAFRSMRVRPVPQTKLKISFESGILDLSIQTKDMTKQELLRLLDSYRKKKRWFRMKGDFIDLSDTSELDELDKLATSVNISLEDLIRGNVSVPGYRALYLDKMLEEHEEIAASRDKHFKSLIRSFDTIRDSDYEPCDELTDTLRQYQLYGFRWLSTLANAGLSGILADEMGLGKTIQMLAFIQSLYDAGENGSSLIVCPASLVYNWMEECQKFTPRLPVSIIVGTPKERKEIIENASDNRLYVTSYDLLKRDIQLYTGHEFCVIALDEAQFIKTQKAAVTKSVKILKAKHRFALTGTPIENRLSELWSIFDFLMPGFLYTASEFSSSFETPIMKKKDAEMTEKLAKMTQPFILRRKKMDVLKDLPEKLEETQCSVMEDEQRKLYDAQVVRMKSMLENYDGKGEDKIRILAEITRLRQICCDPSLLFENYDGTSAKREACIDLIGRAIDGGHRMLVFSQFTSMLALLEEDLKKEKIPYYVITGSTPKQERLRLVNEFNDGDVPVFLISLKAGGTGLNLTGADIVIHYDPWWNLAVQNQATDRAHRIGQTKQVTVVKLITANSIEEKIVELQEAKRDLADAIISENNSLMSMSKDELLALLS